MAQAAAGSEQAAAAAAPVGVNATPLGLFAFGLTFLVLSFVNAGLIVPAVGAGWTSLLAWRSYMGACRAFVSMFEFRAGNNFTGAVFSSYSALWLSFGFIVFPATGILAALAKEGTLYTGLGLYLLAWTIFTVLILIYQQCRSHRHIRSGDPDPSLLTIAFLQETGRNAFHALGGYLGIVSSVLAWYLALAGILPYVNPGLKLPVGPIS